MIRLENISKRFDKTKVLEGLTLSVDQGEFFTLLGPSGCGKTTTLRIIAGFIYPDTGNVFINGKDVSRIPPEKRGLGMVFQNYALFPHMTVAENISFGLKLRKLSKARIQERVDKYLELIRLQGYQKRKIAELSGGQQQRVAVARALAIEPEILLMDEPLSNLDAKLREEMRSEIREIQRHLGIAAVYVTHDQAEALAMSDRIAVFEKGKCTQIGGPEEIYNNPENPFIANFVGATNIVPCSITGYGDSWTEVETLMTKIKLPVPAGHVLPGEACLSIRPEGLEPCAPELADLSGILKEVVFNGSVIHLTVGIGNVNLQVQVLNDGSGSLPGVNGKIGLRIKERGITFIPASGADHV
jgi:iron(III) transport system ATP-binding protein